MDQIKIGNFLKELRKSKNVTQEELAEKLNTSRRTISRWETGNNMPDLDIIPEIAEYFGITINEFFNGERNNKNMNENKQTLLKAAEYTNEKNTKITKAVCGYFIFGLISLIIHEILSFIDLPSTFWVGFSKGATFGLALVAMVVGILYSKGYLNSLKESKKRIFNKLS